MLALKGPRTIEAHSQISIFAPKVKRKFNCAETLLQYKVCEGLTVIKNHTPESNGLEPSGKKAKMKL